MADSFNPYRDWLGLANGQRPATHYGLFGLRPLESDPAEIRKAMARLVARLRGIQPGNRKREWQAIIKEISIAKDCLTDPAAKAAYDAQLRASRGATGTAPRDARTARPPATGQAKGATPPADKGRQEAPAKQSRTTKPPKAPAPARGAPPMATPPVANPGDSAPPQVPEWLQIPVDEAPEVPDWLQIPLSQAPASGHPQGHQGNPPPVAGVPPVAPGIPPVAPGVPPVAPGVPPVAPGIPPIAPPQASLASRDAAVDPPEEMSFAPDPEASQIAIPVDVFWDPSMEEVPERTWTLAGLTIASLVTLLMVLAPLIGYEMYKRYVREASAARARQTDQAQLAKASAKPARPTASDPKKSAAEEHAQNKVSLQTSLTELVAALAKRDMAAAQAIVAQARANAQSPDDQKTVERYAKLSEDVREFLRILGGRVSKFQPSEEVTLGKTRIIVVEARDGRFSFRYGSKILNYTIETLPTWLVTALADGMANDGPSKEMYGAFLAVDPEGDRPRARALWSEAAKMGVNIDQLLPSLDSLPTAPGL